MSPLMPLMPLRGSATPGTPRHTLRLTISARSVTFTVSPPPRPARLRRSKDRGARCGANRRNEEMDKGRRGSDRGQDASNAGEAWDLDRHVEIAMDAMRLPAGDAPVAQLSGGERRRVALCK